MIKKHEFILITTSFRSGSSLLSKILNAHSKIAMSTDKIKFFRYCYDRYLPLNETNLNKMIKDLDSRLQKRFNICIDVDAIKKESIKNQFDQAKIYKAILEEYFKNHNKTIIGEMENLAWTKIPFFLDNVPDSKAMIILRDPRDVVTSFKKFTFAPGDDYLISVFNLVDQMNHIIRLQSRYPSRFYCVRYEKLKRETEKEVRRITNFLNVKFEPSMLEDENWLESTGKKWKNEKCSSFYDKSKPDDKELMNNPVERWKKIITDEDLFITEWILSKQLDTFNFKKSNRKFSQEIFNKSINKLTSSQLLRDAFKKWCETSEGVEKYPVDPLDPNGGHKEYLKRLKK